MKALRLQDKINQIVHISLGVAKIVDITRVYSHSDGLLSGSAIIDNKRERVVSLNNNWKIANESK